MGFLDEGEYEGAKMAAHAALLAGNGGCLLYNLARFWRTGHLRNAICVGFYGLACWFEWGRCAHHRRRQSG